MSAKTEEIDSDSTEKTSGTVGVEQIKSKASHGELANSAGKSDVNSIANDQLAYESWKWINANLDVRYVPGREQFIVCDNGVWGPNDEIIGELTVQLLKTSFKSRILTEVEAFAKNTNVTREHELGVAGGEIPFRNGILDLGTRSLRDTKPGDYVIRPIPHDFDPNVSYEGTTFRGFMREVVPDEKQLKTLQEFTGYLFARGELPYQKAMMLVGEPAAGKGSFLRVVQTMLGDENIMNASLQQLTGSQFSAYRLENKLANIYPDLSGKGLDASEVKTLTGDDNREVEQKYNDPKDIRVTAKLMFAMNETPPLENDDDAFYRRLLFAEFPNRHTDNPNDGYPDIDQSIEDKIKGEEIQAVINWALDGYDRLTEQGRFTGTLSTDEARTFWHINGDPVSQFIQDRITEDDDTEPLTSKEIVREFTQSMIGTGRHIDIGQRAMTRRVKDHFPGHNTENCRIPSMNGRQLRAFKRLCIQPE